MRKLTYNEKRQNKCEYCTEFRDGCCKWQKCHYEPEPREYRGYPVVLEHLEEIEQEPSGDLISREETLTAFADYVGSGMSMNDYDALWDIVAKMPAVKQEPKFIAKSDGTIEQIKNCNDCLFKKEWEKIGKLLSNILEKHTEQEPCEDAISRQAAIDTIESWLSCDDYNEAERHIMRAMRSVLYDLPSVKPQEPKTGYREYNDIYDHYLCGNCKTVVMDYDNFCPNCGCRVVEPQERSEKECTKKK